MRPMFTLLASLASASPLRDAVVFVEQGSSACAGTLIDAEGTVLTAYHCVTSGGRPRITTRGGDLAIGRVIGMDRARDLALVETGLHGLPWLPVRAEPPALDEPVDVVGHPRAASEPGGFLAGTLRWSVSTGTVSALGSEAIQVTAPINPGNSGGPVVDAEGRVIGVVSRRLGGDGLGFAGRVDGSRHLERRGLGVGGWVRASLAGVTTGAAFAVGLSVDVELRDRVVFGGTVAAPVGGRWEAFGIGTASQVPYSARAGLRHRFFRGRGALRLDALGGIASFRTLAFDGTRFTTTRALRPAVEGRLGLPGGSLAYAALLGPEIVHVIRLELPFPGPIWKL